MALQDEIEAQAARIKSSSYPMSVGELVNLYRDKELDVHPEFQRVYRWKERQKTRLIESMLLGIPIPPIFVAQAKNGVWDVVDGVQRLSTIFQFMGELYDDEKPPKKVEPLVLEGTDFLPSLKGKSWSGTDPFTRDQQLYLKRAKIDVNIVLKESDEKTKYELFMRLNTGGSILSPQEVRNCLMIMAYPETYAWIRALSESAEFLQTISVSDRLINEKYHMELVTRFFIFRQLPEADLSKVEDIGDFLNNRLGTIDNLRKEKKESEEEAFFKTFRFIHLALEDDAFTKYDASKKRFLGGFSISAFEVIALGIGFNVHDGLPDTSRFVKLVEGIWSDPTFEKYSGSGVRASERIPRIVPLGRKRFAHGQNKKTGSTSRRNGG